MKTYKGKITKLKPNQIAVVGTNPQGIHGAGAALWARMNAGLMIGHSRELCGSAWGIVTKDLAKDVHPSIPPDEILHQLTNLATYSRSHPDKEFIIFYAGKGYNLNGYTPAEMARIFSWIVWPENVIFERNFAKLMKNGKLNPHDDDTK